MPNNPNKVDEVLSSLDGIQRAQAPAFFYARLRGRMEQELESAGGPIVRWLTKPALALSIAALVLILNATAILEMREQHAASSTDNSTQQLIASDYPMGSYPVYDETPVAP